MKNAPAATARRATNQIVRGPVQQVLAGAGAATARETATEVGMEIAAPAVRETLTEAPAVIVVAEHYARAVMAHRLIARAVMATDHTRLAHRATGIDPILRAPLVTGTRVRAVMAHRLIARDVMVRLARLARLATVPTLLVLLAMGIRVPVAMAMTAHVFPAATAIQAAGLLGAMAIRQVDLPVRGETALIRQAPRATDPDQSVLVAIGLTVLVRTARTARIGRVPIVPMATSHGASGSPMGESVARSARR